MHQKIRWITYTAAMLALLICLQALGSLIPDQMTKQLVTGTCVNATLAVTGLIVGMSSGLTVAVISPVCAFLLGIAPNFITVLPIMVGNACFVAVVLLLSKAGHRALWCRIAAVILGAAVKSGVLYLLVVQLICGVAADHLLGQKLGQIVLLAPPMLKMLPVMFGWTQLATALAGGTLALLITPVLRKALHK